ncbi:carboxypeptidase family protein [Pseudonocardia hierapolitana]|uniref:Carboxypeptidase family protein n=2 Tax=Pseudonocardia hierapolitana TaxID=1128676 RepID=A0A561SPT0_9PSEU|nr:carboxypeptidase family protein [Pseudonocardia hierapolitana]
MAVGLGGGQPWREPPAPPAPLRIVPAAEPPAPEPPAEPESATPVQIVPAEAESQVDVPEEPSEAPAEDTSADDAPVRLVPREAGSVEQEAPHEPSEPVAQPHAGRIEPGVDDAAGTPRSGEAAETGAASAEEVRAQSVPVSPEPAPRPEAVWIEPGAGTPRSGEAAEIGTSGEETPVESVPAEVSPGEQPVAPEPVAQPQAVWIEPGATGASERETAEPAESAPTEGEIPLPDGWDDVEGEDLPAGAVPDRFAEERTSAPEAQVERRRSRQTPDERAAEQAAADLALLRTFGFADPGLRPDSAPVVEMERPDEEEPRVAAGDAQPVRYRVVRRDGSVVGGATVTLLDDRGGDVAAGAADAEGRGELVAPSPGGYVLVSTAAGHQPGAVAITVNGSVTETDILVARSSSVSGSVVGEDGPIVGARVTLVQDGEAVDAVDTGADGTYRISDIGAGEYGLSVAAAGCEPVATLLDVADEADVRHDVVLEPASPVADSNLVEDDAMSGLR